MKINEGWYVKGKLHPKDDPTEDDLKILILTLTSLNSGNESHYADHIELNNKWLW